MAEGKTTISRAFQERSVTPRIRRRYRRWLPGLLLAIVTLAAYLPVWNGTPLWDDDVNMTAPELRSAGGLARIWTQVGATQQYYPLTHTVFWIQYHLWGDRTTGYHLLNILLHILSALLLVRILRHLDIAGAWCAGAVFALHPVIVESVAWITELKNTLSLMFFLLSMLCFLRYTGRRTPRPYLIALGLFVLGLLSKTAIAPFPAAALAVVWWKKGALSWKNDIVPLLPFALAGIAFGLVTLYVERNVVGAAGSEFSLSILERFLTAGRAFWFYLGKIFYPAGLMFIYPRWEVNAGIWWHYVFPIAAAVLAGALWAVRRRWRAPAAAFLYFAAMLFPALGFLDVFAFRYSFVADHWQYSAAIGPIVLAVAGLTQASWMIKEKSRRVALPVLQSLVLATLGALTWKQCGMYADSETLYRATVLVNPGCWMAHNNLGLVLDQKNRPGEAAACYRKALEIDPGLAEPYYNLGNILANSGLPDEAAANYRKAIEKKAGYVEARCNLAILLSKSGQYDEALALFRGALELNPGYAEAHYNLGALLENLGLIKDAIGSYHTAVALTPDYVEALANLGLLLAKNGRHDEALAFFKRVLKINPDDINALNNYAFLLLQGGDSAGAVRHLEKALALATARGAQRVAATIAQNIERIDRGADARPETIAPPEPDGR